MKIKTIIFLFFAVFCSTVSVLAQTTADPDSATYHILEEQDTSSILRYEEAAATPTTEYNSEADSMIKPTNFTVTPHQFDEASWKKITEGINYNREQPKPVVEPKRQREPGFSNMDFSGLSGIFKMLLWVLLIGILVVVLVYLLNSDLFGPNNRKLSSATTIDLDNIEQHLQESDLEKYLRQALAQKEYKQAIRLYYLMLIKELSAKEYIEWRKEKTNRQYLYELSTKPMLQTPFRESTRIFERVWYGETAFEERDFEQVAPVFQGFLNKIV
jgi:hypothetical protein